MQLFTQAAEREKNNRAFAFIQIIESRGSTPRHAATMLVDEDGSCLGTIGGGMMERLVLEQATQALALGESRVFSGRMTRQGEGAVGSDCGGAMTVHIAVQPRRPELVLLGAGHVNRAIAIAALPLGFRVTLVDTWLDNLNHRDLPAACQRVHADSFSAGIGALTFGSQSYVVIATNHQDREVLELMIEQPVCYLGLLASRRKAQTFRLELEKKGVASATINALRAPLGLDIGAETPEEIAVSVLAEILQVKHHASAKPCSTPTLAAVSE